MLNMLAKTLILVPWLDPGRASGNGYTIVLKNQTEMCKDVSRVKVESFYNYFHCKCKS